jgi:hypothetical protein
MKTTFAAAIALLISFSAFAQNPNLDFKYALKGYNQSTLKFTEDNYLSESKITQVGLFDPVVAFQWQTKKNNAHEVSLDYIGSGFYKRNGVQYDTIQLDDSGNSFSILAGYEHLILFNKLQNTKLIPSLGFGVNPYFNYYHYKNTYDRFFSESTGSTIGAKVTITPRLLYFFNSRFFGDVNLPLYVADFFHESVTVIQKPTQEFDPSSRTSELEMFPKVYNLRIGLGLKL